MYSPGLNSEASQRYCEAAAQKGYSCKNISPNCRTVCINGSAYTANKIASEKCLSGASEHKLLVRCSLAIAALKDLK